MRFTSFVAGLFAATGMAHSIQTAEIFIQPILSSPSPPTAAPAPILLGKIHYDVADPSSATVTDYEAPELPEDTELVRIGVWGATGGSRSGKWRSSTTIAGVENFDKGYSPSLLLSVDQRGDILGATLKGVRVDAGQTRDSAPRAVVLISQTGKQPELNKPVVLSPSGRKQQAEEEKTFLQKYWMFILAGALILMSGSGEGK
ncbi:hypothetical protein Cpir12675_004423 [Ceratocystis pirilliformis]|uniref:Cyclin-dependent protein kinase regulator pho80 n=1 Tax=Ceratocystis pirilliformis TaxID=259994 RepID=A0ABR3YXP3_9PEZI